MNYKKTVLIPILLVAVAWAESDEKGFIYSPVGKRDPFHAPSASVLDRNLASINPLEKFTVEQLQLRAILRMSDRHRAMFEDPEGKTHILSEGDTIGRERATISRILGKSVVLTLKTFNYLGEESLFEKVVSLPSDTPLEQSVRAK